MKLLLSYRIIFAFLLAAIITPLAAQDETNPLMPAAAPKQKETGILFGYGQDWQSGSYHTDCDCPPFSGGVKAGLQFGGLYQQDFNKSFMWGGMLLFETRSLNSSYIQKESDIVKTKYDSTVYVNLPWRNRSESRFYFISAIPYLQWNPADVIFLRIGASASFMLTGNYKQTKQLLQKTAPLSDGQIVEVDLLTPRPDDTEIVADTTFPGISRFQFGLVPMVGATIPIALNIYISPVIQFYFPLTDISSLSRNQGFKISSWRGSLEFRWAFNMRE